MTASVSPNAASATCHESGLRYVVESLACLALAVMLVRALAVEGYIISTGSMAPFLLGYHKQVVCPECQFPFAVGVPVEDDPSAHGPVTCPNCGQGPIELGQVPRNEGDQLLVQKLSYLFRRPWRWEIVVFQNPSRPTQAYVKRVIGLPGEEVQVLAGDVWINGELVRKDLAEQRSTRIPIDSHAHRPQGRDDLRWQADDGWKTTASGFEFSANRSPAHSTGDGRGEGASSDRGEALGPLTLALSPDARERGPGKDASLAWVTYRGDAPKRVGTQPPKSVLQTWPADDYAYNALVERSTRYLVRDVMAAMQIELQRGRGEFSLVMSDGQQTFEVRLAAGDRELRLFVDGHAQPDETAKLSGPLWQNTLLIEMSLFDRQFLFALGGQTIFTRKLNGFAGEGRNGRRAGEAAGSNGGSPVRFGARDLHVNVSELTLYRDVFYTRGDGRHGVGQPHQLGPDEYFFLGDNSPVSLDSRSWADAVVRDHMLIGKPFLVHLPSRPGRVKVGSAELHIRVPDWSRIRYIR